MTEERTSRGRSWDDVRPELAAGVTVDPPLHDGASWVIAVAQVPHARVGEDFARLAAAFDGRRSVREAATSAGLTVDAVQALDAVEALASAGLLRAASPRDSAVTTERRHRHVRHRHVRHRHDRRRSVRPDSTRRFRYRPPLTFQWRLFDPSRLAAALARPLRVRRVRIMLSATAALVIALAGVAVATELDAILETLAAPLPIDVVSMLIIAVILTGCVHEIAHAVTLSAAGGRPTRMGIMVFYFMPALFCDVTDGWRLAGRWRRAAVALAGPSLHLVVGAASFASLLLIDDPGARSFLVLYGCACLVAVGANLLPFIKLDGYLALVAITDTPYLRKVATTAARRAVARMLFGVELRAGAPRDPIRVVVFGMLCVLFPLVLFVWAAIRLQPSFLGWGPWMAAMYFALVLTFTVATASRVLRFIASCLRRRPHPGRAAAGAGAALVAATLLLLVPTQPTAHAGFVVRGDDVLLVSSAASTLGAFAPGDAVVLRTNGVVLRPEIGTAVVAGGTHDPVEVSAPLSALAPVVAPASTAPVWGIPLAGIESSDRLPFGGVAEVMVDGPRPVGVSFAETLIGEPVRRIVEGAGIG